jgi:hypothetical protein
VTPSPPPSSPSSYLQVVPHVPRPPRPRVISSSSELQTELLAGGPAHANYHGKQKAWEEKASNLKNSKSDKKLFGRINKNKKI